MTRASQSGRTERRAGSVGTGRDRGDRELTGAIDVCAHLKVSANGQQQGPLRGQSCPRIGRLGPLTSCEPNYGKGCLMCGSLHRVTFVRGVASMRAFGSLVVMSVMSVVFAATAVLGIS